MDATMDATMDAEVVTLSTLSPVSPSSDVHVRSLARGLAVIRAFEADSPVLTLSEVARRTGLTRAAARRFLLTLVDLGYVRQDDTRFSLSPRVLELGYAYLSSVGLPRIAQPHLESVARRLNESCSLSVLDGPFVVYIARVQTSRIMKVSIEVGTRFPVHATSMGRVLLAGLTDERLEEVLADLPLERFTEHTITDLAALRAQIQHVRGAGYALVHEELEEGLRSIAVPVNDGSGTVCAGMNVSAQASRVSAEEMVERILPELQRASAAVSHDLLSIGR